MYEEVQKLIDPIYLVGGSIRDELLGSEPKDYDFATPLTPDQIEEKLKTSNKKTNLTGKRFGTIGFKLDGQYVEVTTFRAEQYNPGSRKPIVEFVSNIQTDLGRRDFTMNAIAKRGSKIIDPFKGTEDITSKTIRAVGNPTERFKEDPLRMLRAARFASQLGFNVESTTEKSALRHSHKILEVSKERWVQELDKLLIGQDVIGGLNVLARTRLLNFMLPELSIQVGYDQNSRWHELSLWEHTLSTVSLVPNDVTLRWAALLHDIGKPFVRTTKNGNSNYILHDRVGAELAWKFGRYLRWSNDRTEQVSNLIYHHLEDSSPIRAADNASKIMH